MEGLVVRASSPEHPAIRKILFVPKPCQPLMFLLNRGLSQLAGRTSSSRHLGHLLAAMVLPELQPSGYLSFRPQPSRNLDYLRQPALTGPSYEPQASGCSFQGSLGVFLKVVNSPTVFSSEQEHVRYKILRTNLFKTVPLNIDKVAIVISDTFVKNNPIENPPLNITLLSIVKQFI